MIALTGGHQARKDALILMNVWQEIQNATKTLVAQTLKVVKLLLKQEQ